MNNGGMALVTGLVLLAAVSLLAMTAANSMNLSRRQAANLADTTLAEENARLAEAWARAWLYSRADIERDTDCSSDCVQPFAILPAASLPAQPQFEGAAWWQSNGHAAATHPESGATYSQPPDGVEHARWVMEEVHSQPTSADSGGTDAALVAFYRILARGTGRQPRSVAVTESLVARPWDGDYTPARYPPSGGANEFCRQFGMDTTCGTLAWRQLK